MRTLYFYLIVITLSGCAAFPQSYPKEVGKCRVRGDTVGGVAILIRKIDDGPLNFGPGYRLRQEAWVLPGDHRLDLMCETVHSWGTTMEPKITEVSVEEGFNYVLKPKISGSSGENIDVIVNKIPQ